MLVQGKTSRRRPPAAVGGDLQQRTEARRADCGDRQAHQEAVEEGVGHFVFRHLVGGTDGADQGAVLASGAVVEFALVEQRQQGIEYGAVGLEHLVDESNRGVRQESVGVPLIAILFQRFDRQRTEQLLGHREAGQQALEVAAVAKHRVQAPRQLALRRAGGADQQRVLARQSAQQTQPDALAAFHQAAFQRVDDRLQTDAVFGLHG